MIRRTRPMSWIKAALQEKDRLKRLKEMVR